MDTTQFKHERIIEILRPAVLPDDKRLFSYLIVAGSLISLVGIFLGNSIMVVLPLIVLAVFPGLPVLFHLIYHIFVKIEILPDKLIITDHVSNRFVRFKTHQEISFSEICYIYYLGKEINLLLNLKNKLKKFKIPAKETDHTKANLIARYGVPEAIIDKFEKSTQKLLSDYTATGVMMKLDEIYDKYNVPKETKDSIKKALKNDTNFNFDNLKTALGSYPINSQDLESLNDELTHIDTNILAPFLLTKVNLVKYQKAEKYRHGAHIIVRTDNGLVISNQDGTKKIYLMHFHNLSERALHRFIEIVRSKQPGVKFLMTKKEREHLLVK